MYHNVAIFNFFAIHVYQIIIQFLYPSSSFLISNFIARPYLIKQIHYLCSGKNY